MNVTVVDAFDLPDWLGTASVQWRSDEPIAGGFSVQGALHADDGRVQQLDLLAVDAAYPRPVCPERDRTAVHQAWHYGEVALLSVDGRTAAGLPGQAIDVELVCEALRRVAKSVGASAGSYTVTIPL
jgi:hypothetical protein